MSKKTAVVLTSEKSGWELLFSPLQQWAMQNCTEAGVDEIYTIPGNEQPLTCNQTDDLLFLSADAPFLFPETLTAAYEQHKQYGSDATAISGTACWIKGTVLPQTLDGVTVANLLKMLRENGLRVDSYDTGSSLAGMEIKTRRQLHELSEIARELVFEQLWEAGAHIPVTDGIIISREAVIGEDTTILPGTIIKGNTTIGKGCVIGPNSMLDGAKIGDSCRVEATKITSAVLEDDVQIGPFSQVRPNSLIKRGVRIGDFVEVKNSVIGENTHASHLTYIGDTDCGARVNFGCGVVTVNYNGREKNRTTIGNDCFVGCNTNLVAPVTLADGAYTAAGSTVTVDVPKDSLCIARAREVIKEGRAVKYRKGKSQFT